MPPGGPNGTQAAERPFVSFALEGLDALDHHFPSYFLRAHTTARRQVHFCRLSCPRSRFGHARSSPARRFTRAPGGGPNHSAPCARKSSRIRLLRDHAHDARIDAQPADQAQKAESACFFGEGPSSGLHRQEHLDLQDLHLQVCKARKLHVFLPFQPTHQVAGRGTLLHGARHDLQGHCKVHNNWAHELQDQVVASPRQFP